MTNEQIQTIIEDFLKKLTIEFDKVEFVKTAHHDTFLIYSQDAGILIGNRGETLEALSYLIRRALERIRREAESSDESRDVFIIDVNNYQTKKIQELIDSAQISARRAKLFKQSVELSPMSSYERMIIHSVFTEDPEITTESQGEGKYRRVTLRYSSSVPGAGVDSVEVESL